jgi:hypothetical protein
VAAILRPAPTPKGTGVCTVVKHVTKRLRKHWPNTRIAWRGDSHYGRVEANLRFHHAKSRQETVRTYTSFSYQAGSWKRALQGGRAAGVFLAAGRGWNHLDQRATGGGYSLRRHLAQRPGAVHLYRNSIERLP